jgi:hypothetical protein
VLLALPAASVIMVLIRHIHETYLGSHFYGDLEAPLDPPANKAEAAE